MHSIEYVPLFLLLTLLLDLKKLSKVFPSKPFLSDISALIFFFGLARPWPPLETIDLKSGIDK